jgi:ribosome assembly protein 1
LRERYAKIEIDASTPIVPFRESICNEPGRMEDLKWGSATTADRTVKLIVQARPLPANVTAFLNTHRDRIDVLLDSQEFLQDDVIRNGLEREMSAAGSKWLNLLPYLWAIGPRGGGCNLMFNRVPDYADTEQWQARKTLRFKWKQAAHVDTATTKALDDVLVKRNNVMIDLDGTIQSGFQLAVSRGPLCEEPMMGVCFIVVGAEVDTAQLEDPARQTPYGPLSGQMITAVRDACRSAFLSKAARLYEATYVCDVRTSEKYLGKVSTVLGRRRAEIFEQDYDTDHSVITLRALLPVRESFGLYQEMIAECSGAASIQLKLHGWNLLNIDPFYVPKSNADLEDYGENVASSGTNLARELLDEARRRKGLPVEERLVDHAEKQRTLSKKK